MNYKIILAIAVAMNSSVYAGDRESKIILDEADKVSSGESPVRRIERENKDSTVEISPKRDYRRIDGSENNLKVTSMGSAGIPLARMMPPAYDDGVSQPAGTNLKSARSISNLVAEQTGSILNSKNTSDYIWQWGQFLDHDIDLTDGSNPPEPMPIQVAIWDPFFDPEGTGTVTIPLNRSIYNSGVDKPRQQLNEITAWIDASNVYGSEIERAHALRTNDGTGKLKTSEGNLLPFNTNGLPNAGGSSDALFLAGDVRANEQVALTAMHTLFVREHNRIANNINSRRPNLSGEEVYQRARRKVGAIMQVITYNEYLPALLGENAIPEYTGYKPEVNGGIANMFSTACYRYGHSALSPTLLRLDKDNNEILKGNIPLRDSFFAPSLIVRIGIEPYLRGLAKQTHQNIDPFVIDDVRNFLFGMPGEGGFDLASLNIQRGRDHGLPKYNAVRKQLGLKRKLSFAEVSSDPEVQDRLAAAYETVDDIELWIGGLSEDHVEGALVGELIHTVLVRQFTALRDGDRYWYQNKFSERGQENIERSTLSRVIKRNTNIGREISNNVFYN